MPLCECGCGLPVSSRFRRGHNPNKRVRVTPEEKKATRAAWQRVNRGKYKDAARCAALKARYGIPCEQYNEMLVEQGGVCAICEGTNPSGHKLAVDHDHDTGRVRGLLCHACNAGIGKLRDNAELLRRGADYIERSARSN